MHSYLLETTIYWAAFYLLYRLFLQKETFFKTNRFYLLGTFVLGALIPFFEAATYIPTENPFEVWLPAIQILPEQVLPTLEAETSTSISWSSILIGVYLLGVVISTSRFLLGLFKINGLVSRGEKANLSGFSVIKTEEIKTPFSFFGNLFWSNHLDHLDHAEKQQILLHESAHINQMHSCDVMVFEAATILFWWNPMVYAYKHSIREVHEFLADDYVIRQSNKQQYGHLLIGQSKTFANLMASGNALALANHFFHSQLKKRIMMMTKKKSQAISQLKYLVLMPLMVMLVFACETLVENEFPELDENEMAKEKAMDTGEEFLTDTIITFDPITKTETIDILKSSVYKVVEEMPRFPGCEDEPGGIDAIEKCAQQKLLENIYKSVKYPKVARDAGIEGVVVATFVVSSYGNIVEPKIVRSVSPEIDTEVLRVVGEMPPWISGKQSGKKVNVRYHLPVSFKLQ